MSKTVLITGTSRGIGKATAEEFAKNGWNVITHARKQTEGFESYTVNLAKTCKVIVSPIYFDMLDSETMKKSISTLKKNKTVIDTLVNNAGIVHGDLFQMTSIATIKNVFDINLFSHMELTQLVLKILAKENASIVNVASVAGIEFRGGNSAYGVSKAAMIAWTKILEAELHNRVRVNAIAPGLTETDMAQELEDKYQLITASRNAINRLAKPEEIAKAIFFLSSDAASFITGQVLRVDGGGGI